MKTTRKQLVNFAIELVKEVSKQNKRISVEYRNNHIHCLFFNEDNTLDTNHILWLHRELVRNKKEFRKAILKIRGIVL